MEISKEGRRIRSMFADISPRYDFLNHFLSLGVDRAWRARAVRAVGVKPSDRILDVCTGTGDLAMALARRVDPDRGGRVVGTDFCPEMLTLGERKRRARGLTPLALAAADTLALPFADATFDAVTVAFGIRNVEHLSAGLAELARVAREGGRLAVLEFSRPPSRWLRWTFELYFWRLLPRLAGWISGTPQGWRAYRYLPASVREFPGPEELARKIETAGWSDVRHRRLWGGVACLHTARRAAPFLPPREAEARREVSRWDAP